MTNYTSMGCYFNSCRFGRHNTWHVRAVILACLGLIHGCAPVFPPNDPDNFNEFARQRKVLFDGLELHYVEAGTPGKPLILFVHGTPGSWHAFAAFLQDKHLAANTHMIAVDRLGFGESAKSGPRPSFDDQAQSIGRLLELNKSDTKTVVVGHSLGGSIGIRLAVDYPNHVGALLVISSAISPQLGGARWYNHFANLAAIRWIIPNSLNIANIEIMPLADELAAIEPRLADLIIPVTVIQGAKDKLVSPANADYVEATFVNAVLRIKRFPNAGHFLIWEQPDVVTDEVLHLVHQLDKL